MCDNKWVLYYISFLKARACRSQLIIGQTFLDHPLCPAVNCHSRVKLVSSAKSLKTHTNYTRATIMPEKCESVIIRKKSGVLSEHVIGPAIRMLIICLFELQKCQSISRQSESSLQRFPVSARASL
jgi:hypothetical protein